MPRRRQFGAVDQIVLLVRVEVVVVQHLLLAGLCLPAMVEHVLFCGCVVRIGEHQLLPFIEATDIDVALGAHGTHRFVGGVIGLLEEQLFVQSIDGAVHQRQQGLALQPGHGLQTDEVTDRG